VCSRPKYDTLGEQFASDANIVIAKVDSTENDTPAKVEGFPTIIFYPAGDKKNPITFEGDRSVEAMAAFIKENRKSAPAAAAEGDHAHEEL
jgi:protein disulfide-isomerase A1